MKLNQVLGLPKFYQGVSNKNLPFSLAYKLNKLALRANEELDFYRENMQKIIEEFAERNENGDIIYTTEGDIRIAQENLETCEARITELSNIEVDIDIKFKPSELESLELSINDIQNLMPLIEE